MLTPKQIYQSLVELAAGWPIYHSVGRMKPEQRAREVGKLLDVLPADQRETLKSLKSEDVANPAFTEFQGRPRTQRNSKRVKIISLK
jgi:hypothetical protein